MEILTVVVLNRENVGWASTCNSVGQTAGYFLGNVVFLALESKDFANRYVRQPLHMELQPTGLITLPGNISKQMFYTEEHNEDTSECINVIE